MKRALCFLLVIFTLVLFSGCNDKTDSSQTRPTVETDASDVDIVKYVKKGTMPEIEYTLGDDVEKAKSKAIEDKDLEAEQLMEGDEYTTIITNDNVNLIYETKNAQKGIQYIVGFGKCYGFDSGTDSNTVSEVMKSAGFNATLKAIPQNLIKFVPASSGCECLSYTISEKSLNFVFDNNYLAATIIYEKG